MEFRQFNNYGGHYDGGASQWGALRPRWMTTGTLTSGQT